MATTLTADNRVYIVKEWEWVSCLFCGSEKRYPHENFGPDHKYEYVKCEDCGLVYTHRRPKYDQEFLDTAYSVYDTESHHVRTSGLLSKEERELMARYQVTIKQLEENLGRKGRLLEIGCATGLFLLAARELGWEVMGVDISQAMVTTCRSVFGIEALCGQYHELDLSAYRPFDAIYCSHVLEHIPVPNLWMQKFREDLVPEGILCINVPNQYSVDRVVKRGLKSLGLKRDNWALWRTPDHLFEPHHRPMAFLFEKNHFTICDYFTYSRKEQEEQSFFQKILHHRLRWGSKLRYFARP